MCVDHVNSTLNTLEDMEEEEKALGPPKSSDSIITNDAQDEDAPRLSPEGKLLESQSGRTLSLKFKSPLVREHGVIDMPTCIWVLSDSLGFLCGCVCCFEADDAEFNVQQREAT